jgi:hypothetical protein
MFTQKPKPKPESLVKTMLAEDRNDAMDYISEQLTLSGLRSATQNLQAVCCIVHQLLSQKTPNIIDAYKVANIVSTGFHDNINIFQEIKRDSVEFHKGHITVPSSVNMDSAYISEKLTEAKSDYLAVGVANMLDILNLTAHILSRENITKKSLMTAKWVVSHGLYKPCTDVVSTTNMNHIWNLLVRNAIETITGPANRFITMGETRSVLGHKIFFTPSVILVDDEEPVAKDMEILNVSNDPNKVKNQVYCTLFFMNLDAWLYFHESGEFAILRPDKDSFDLVDRLSVPKEISKSLFQELVA